MAITPPKNDSRLGKGYSYLFALFLTTLIAAQSTDISFKFNKSGIEFAIASRELNPQVFYPCVALIAAILGLPTDAIALALGQILTKGRE
ncbi:MAG TPA: hypothetical protein VE944_28975 [Nostoc sp.]|uniref:hypothetical protein n=1 Tax=Nostoc sp. TaxID=1180 RepID=UPI002D22D8D9|nr:hypothetical protein [Nostoc sp.]HYX18328.1 hypothetical protein [Nostoc sp.]